MAIIEGTSVEGLVRLFRDNIWKLHGLLESVVSDRGPQLAAELTKKLNRMLEIKTKLSTAFHSQTDVHIKRINQGLEQCLRFFVDHRQKNQLEWLVLAKFVVMSYASPPIWKLHSCGEFTSKSYKPTFHSGHLSCNMSYGSAATLQVFRLPQRRYSYSTRSSITELLLSVFQH